MKFSRLLWLEKRHRSYDLIYSRTFLWSPWLQALFKKFPSIVEINGNLSAELIRRSKLSWAYGMLTHYFLLMNTRGLVCVSHEIARFYRPFGKKVCVLANGATLTTPGPLANPNPRPQMAFIGTNQAWHGIDKVLILAQQCPEFDFHIIGFNNAHSSPNIYNHGVLSHEKAMNILKTCDVGISSLALHRAGITEASPLKSREYLSLGLACILAYQDTDLSESEFVLSLANTENNILERVEDIKQFVWKIKKSSDFKQQIRRYFQEHLSWDAKENQRLAFFSQLLGH